MPWIRTISTSERTFRGTVRRMNGQLTGFQRQAQPRPGQRQAKLDAIYLHVEKPFTDKSELGLHPVADVAAGKKQRRPGAQSATKCSMARALDAYGWNYLPSVPKWSSVTSRYLARALGITLSGAPDTQPGARSYRRHGTVFGGAPDGACCYANFGGVDFPHQDIRLQAARPSRRQDLQAALGDTKSRPTSKRSTCSTGSTAPMRHGARARQPAAERIRTARSATTSVSSRPGSSSSSDFGVRISGGRRQRLPPFSFWKVPVKPELRRFGTSQSPVVVIDDFSGDAEGIARDRRSARAFPMSAAAITPVFDG